MIFLGVSVVAFLVLMGVGFYNPPVMKWGGIVIMAIGGFWMVGKAYEEDSWCGFACMRIPFYSFYYMFTRFGVVWPTVVLQVLGLIAMLGGTILEVVAERNGFGQLANDDFEEELDEMEDVEEVDAADEPQADDSSPKR